MSHNHSEKYKDDELKAMAICTINAINSGNPMGSIICHIISQQTRMPPQLIIQEIQKLANIKV